MSAPPPTFESIFQNVIRTLTAAGAVAATLVGLFLVARASGILDRYIQSQHVAVVKDWQNGFVVYRLNRTALELNATFEITACKTVSIKPLHGDDTNNDGKTAYRLMNVAVVDDKLTPRIEPDPAHAWAILQNSIEGLWWSTTFVASLDARGRLTEVNTTSTSVKPQEVVKPITDLLGQLAGPVRPPVGVQAASAGTVQDDATFCGPAINEALTRQSAVESRLAAKPPADEATVLSAELSRIKALLRKSLSVTLVPRRPPATLDVRRERAELLRDHGLGVYVDPGELFPDAGDGLKRELRTRAFEVRVLAPVQSGAPAATPTTVKGIVHRIPAQVSIVTCRQRCVADARGEFPSHNVLKGPETVAIAQLGADIVTEIRRAPFSDRKAKLTFDASGVLTGVDLSDTAQVPK
jgi:hypothetical protein